MNDDRISAPADLLTILEQRDQADEIRNVSTHTHTHVVAIMNLLPGKITRPNLGLRHGPPPGVEHEQMMIMMMIMIQ